MKQSLKFSFDDEPAKCFSYNIEKKIISIMYGGYYDEVTKIYNKQECYFKIEGWQSVRCEIGRESKVVSFEEGLGIFSIILYMRYIDDVWLELFVNMIDDRYVSFYFENPELKLE